MDCAVPYMCLYFVNGDLNEVGHHYYCDNYLTGIPEAEDLGAQSTRICGTMKINHKGVPMILRTNIGKGQFIARQCPKGTNIFAGSINAVSLC